MNNPWQSIPMQEPFVLDVDRLPISEFNRLAPPEARIRLEVPPEPYLGRVDAPVVLLNLNPGFGTEERVEDPDPALTKIMRENLLHQDSAYPFYLLNPFIGGPGYRWWTQKFRSLLQRYSQQELANMLLCVEYFPYHSHRYDYRTPHVESQEYSFSLVKQAIARHAVIIMMRSQRLWFQAVPQLNGYSKCYRVRNVRNPTISEGNCPDGFAHIVAALDIGQAGR